MPTDNQIRTDNPIVLKALEVFSQGNVATFAKLQRDDPRSTVDMANVFLSIPVEENKQLTREQILAIQLAAAVQMLAERPTPKRGRRK